jgi:predicted nucleic acid-binding Zn ribbon protein
MSRWDHICLCCGRRVENSPNRKEYCPDCSGVEMMREVPAPSFILKGAGFHRNDYPKKD